MIYIAKHKEVETLKQKDYVPLNMWELKEYSLYKYNYLLNELTAHYHIWKAKEDDIKGIVQYRKYLIDDNTNKLITMDRVNKLLNEYDVITTKRYKVGNGIINNLRSEIGGKKELELLNKYYNKLIDGRPQIEKYLINQTWFNPGNMFICKKEIFNKYCEWLFEIITPLYIEYDKDADNIYKPRLLGYVFERLLTYWLIENNLKVKELEYNIIRERI